MKQLTVPVGEHDHCLGPANAPVTLVEYGDYQCPYCGEFHPIIKELLSRLSGQLRDVYRHFPLTAAHPHAQKAAEAAEAAGAQEMFWEMHEVLFTRQDALEVDDLVQYAAELALDQPRFFSELTGGVHTARVRADFMSGVRSGVNGTPTIFLNGVRHDGPRDFDALWEAIDLTAAEVQSEL